MSIANKLTTLDGMVDEVYEAGRKSIMRAFQTALKYPQTMTFVGPGWNKDSFYPVEDIVLNQPSSFSKFNWQNEAFDFAQRLEDCGVTLTFYGGNAANQQFTNAYITRLPVLDYSKEDSLVFDRTFLGCIVLVTIDKIVLPANGAAFNNSFGNCGSLENIDFEGKITSSISFPVSPLSADSMESIINALKDLSGTSQTATLTLKASASQQLKDADRQNITDKGWTLSEI